MPKSAPEVAPVAPVAPIARDAHLICFLLRSAPREVSERKGQDSLPKLRMQNYMLQLQTPALRTNGLLSVVLRDEAFRSNQTLEVVTGVGEGKLAWNCLFTRSRLRPCMRAPTHVLTHSPTRSRTHSLAH